jgi:hypothetical protein
MGIVLPLLTLALGAARAGDEQRPEPDLTAIAAHIEHSEVRHGDCAIASVLVIARLLELDPPAGDTEQQLRTLRSSVGAPPWTGVGADEVALLLMQMGAAIKEKPGVRLHRLMRRLTAGELALVIGRYEFDSDLHAIVVSAHPDSDGRWLIVHDSNYERPYVATYREVEAFRRRGEGTNQMYRVKSRR